MDQSTNILPTLREPGANLCLSLPILRRTPLLRASHFCVFRCQKVEILEKIARCARRRQETTDDKSPDFASDNAKSKN